MIVSRKARALAWQIWKMAQTEEVYAQMLERLRPVDAKYEAILSKLPEDQRDTICDFVCQCEDMRWRLVQIACEIMCTSDK